METSGVVSIHGKQYQTVALRIHQFRQSHSVVDGWSLLSELIECSEKQVIIKASIVDPAGKTVAEGLAQEVWSSSKINKSSCVENCETSAWGRCLANAGLGGEHFPVASADEVQVAMKADSNRPASSIKDHVWGCKDVDDLYQMLVNWEEKRPIIPVNHENWAGIAAFTRARLADTGWAISDRLEKFLQLVEKATEVQDEIA